jgi:hypothetical protein
MKHAYKCGHAYPDTPRTFAALRVACSVRGFCKAARGSWLCLWLRCVGQTLLSDMCRDVTVCCARWSWRRTTRCCSVSLNASTTRRCARTRATALSLPASTWHLTCTQSPASWLEVPGAVCLCACFVVNIRMRSRQNASRCADDPGCAA